MILLVDDDKAITTSLALALKQNGYASLSVDSPGEALRVLESEHINLVIQDMNFSKRTSGVEGLELLRQFKERQPDLPVILITAWGTIELAVKGMRSGAADFVTKPWSSKQLLQSVKNTLSLVDFRSSDQGIRFDRSEYDRIMDLNGIVGEAPKLLRVFEVMSRVSSTDASILIQGESGTGKELVAETIHRNSPRRDRPFIKVNLGGVSQTLFESEMFGHVRGAFTDAVTDRTGRFEMAHGGTIFLDEIGDLSPPSQVKLLRVLQDFTFEVLGSSRTRAVDVRVISATNHDLSDLVGQGQFREDLLYRLNLITIRLPPLSQRMEDIPLLVEHFLRRASVRYKRPPASISEEALDWLQQLNWPGNVRQLSQLVERTVLICDKPELEVGDLRYSFEMETMAARDRLPEVGSMSLDEMEKAMIVRALEYHDGHISRAAKSLGLSRPAIYRRMEKYGIKI
jgi:DNA-binding NtrC family response regulator